MKNTNYFWGDYSRGWVPTQHNSNIFLPHRCYELSLTNMKNLSWKASEDWTPWVSLPKLKYRLQTVPAGTYKSFRNLLKCSLPYNSFKTNSILQFSYSLGPDGSAATPWAASPIKSLERMHKYSWTSAWLCLEC